MAHHQQQRRSVAFDETIQVHLVPCYYEMSEDEHRQIWLSQEDFKAIRASNSRTVEAMQRRNSCNETEDCPHILLDEEDKCDRGLEHRRSPAHHEQRKINHECCITAALDVQERQRMLEYYDEEEIARASRRGSQWARELARQQGVSDSAGAGRAVDRKRVVHRYNPEAANTGSEKVLDRVMKLCQKDCVIPNDDLFPKNPSRSLSALSVDSMLSVIRKGSSLKRP
mmetsp:Transcript_46437/g.86282  ORF Transcript_46437/g.86282 Transcript_46437/m.86282 type:complete len:226 (-) Transcript_46437:52-729(-)|eukprot:CAMPEP_0197451916 /NCGR_PEP_ID=MMETSP1175-20131217/30530_1 /TAXON_ID=1003142 /ORGANISM="Triceratium dubium, Strain CCMP147" /LENGTH=225 /DNA_ID=CAMNT_0042984785 /DNA_START=136 /DNA_END=813 /DNA_ORIENTATION=+